jgi:hypothetical protein
VSDRIAPAVVETLSTVEVDRLAELEQVVDRGLQTFVEVGQALAEIRDARLYRSTHDTFDEYLRERWSISRSRAHRLIEAAEVVEMLPIGNTPANEAQARELVPLLETPDELVDVMRELSAEHGDRLTAAKVRLAVAERLRREHTLTHGVLASTGTEWYTPARYIDAAREVLGGIDLDPASCVQANETVRAGTYYDADADGLTQDWHGRVWLNPPYGKTTALFVAKLLAEHAAGHVDAAVLLLNGYGFDASWFQPLWTHALCFTDHRIVFASPDRDSGGPTFGNVFVYLGPDRQRFRRVFRAFGSVVVELLDEPRKIPDSARGA